MSEPFPIYDPRNGLVLAKEPWMSPVDAFRRLENAVVYRGQIRRRRGYALFSELGYPVVGEDATDGGSAAGLTSSSGTLNNFPVVKPAGSYEPRLTDGVTIWYAHTDGLIYTAPNGGGVAKGTINYLTGAWTLNIAPSTFAADLTANYEYRKVTIGGDPNAVMGIWNFFPETGGEQLLAMDRRRYWVYDTVEERFEHPATVTQDLFTSTLEDHVWGEQVGDIQLFCNGVDKVYYFDGVMRELHTDWDHPAGAPADPEDGVPAASGSYARKIDNAYMIFYHKNRIVMLRTEEGGTLHAKRARWSEPVPQIKQSYTVPPDVYPFRPEGFADAPSVDFIVSASFLGDDLLVFFERSVWRLQFNVDDALAPFEWEKVAETEGSFARMSTVDFSDELVTLGPTSVVATDGRDVYAIDEAIPDRVLDFNPLGLVYGFGIVVDELRLWMLAFADGSDEFPETVLVHQYEDGVWSIFDLPFHVFGYYEFSALPTMNSYPGNPPMNQIPLSWNERTLRAGFPAVLAGSRDARVYRLWGVGTDDGAPQPPMVIRSQDLNPYTEQKGGGSLVVRLGQLDILCSPHPDESLSIRLYKDFATAPYLSKSIDLTPTPIDGNKVKRRISVNQSGAFHRIEMEFSGSGEFRLDAIIPWFEQDGEVRELY